MPSVAQLSLAVAIAIGVAGALTVACSRGDDPSAAGLPLPSAQSSAPVAVPTSGRARELLALEQRRDSSSVSESDVSSRNVVVRRQAARALARIADARSAELLRRALSDEDRVVVAWAAYGLGFTCRGREVATVRALATRAATLAATPPHAAPDPVAATPTLDAVGSIANALARCATREAEISLRAWLEGPPDRGERAALALGHLASRTGRLDDASVVALLDAASRPSNSLEHALLAFTRLGALGESVQSRLLEVADAALKAKGLRRQLAVRALGRAGPQAVERLGSIVNNGQFSPAERSDAARELARLGNPGQKALASALAQLAPKTAEEKLLLSAAWAPLITVLEAIESPSSDNRDALRRLAELELAEKASSALRRRVARLRCGAASLLAGTASLSARLVACDVTKAGSIGALAMLTVLDRGPLEGARYRRWKQLAEKSEDPVVREAALRLMPAHPEIRRPHETLALALRSPVDGVVATAAQVIAAYPDRASSEATAGDRADDSAPLRSGSVPLRSRPDASVVKALTEALAAKRPEDALQRRAALIDAAGALQLLSLKPSLNEACQSPNATLREHAQTALRLMGERKRRCAEFSPRSKSPKELARALPDRPRLRVVTDAGTHEIQLNAALAPVAVGRILELARSGFYAGTVIHRVVPGFVVQFGDPGGDGFGGAGKPPLACETAPVPFPALGVGVALSGRDTGSSQLFVTLGRYPHLDGDFTLVGRADSGWSSVATGDVIRKVEVLE